MKELEDKLVEELYNNLQNEISKSKINNNKIIEEEKNNKDKIISKMIHEGIVCNKCGMKNIEGVRYKCAQCTEFNLCEMCEKNYIHDMKHIMIKIIYPIKNNNELNYKINRNISYKNQDMNYKFNPDTLTIDGNLDTTFAAINLENSGAEPWRGVYLKCLENISEIIAEECEINDNVNSKNSINVNIKFENVNEQIKPGKYIYYSFFQMFNKNNESFGNITKVKIQIKK